MIKWTFFFDEGHIICEAKDEKEDQRIGEYVDTLDLFPIPGNPIDLYVNANKLKLISREIVDEKENSEGNNT